MRLFLAMGLALVFTSVANAQQFQPMLSQAVTEKAMTYSQAYKKAQAGDKPLLVMVTADWCPPCRVMKANTLPVLLQKKTFENFHFAMLDYDKESEIANQLIGDRGLPQLIMYEKSNGKWLRRYINGQKGIHSVEKVEKFVAEAGTIRLASKEGENENKKK